MEDLIMRKKISKVKKVWIFKWLLKKAWMSWSSLREENLRNKGEQKAKFCKVILDMNNGKRFII